MLKIAVCVSGGGTNLQAIIDGIEQKTITNTEIAVVISNNPGAYALERAKKHGIEAVCISPKEYESRAAFNEDFLRRHRSDHSAESGRSAGGRYAGDPAAPCHGAGRVEDYATGDRPDRKWKSDGDGQNRTYQ